MKRSTLSDWLTFPLALPLAYINPISRTAIKVIQATWANNNAEGALELGRNTPKEIREFLTAEVMQQVSEIFKSPNKLLAVREKLANNVLMLAKFLVVVLPLPSESSGTNFDWREFPGISGEIGAHLDQLAFVDDDIKELKEKTGSTTSKELRQACEFAYHRYRFGVAVFDSIRKKLGDRHKNEEKDWVRPFIHAMCAWEESNFRKNLDLPDILAQQDDFGNLAAIKYATFLNFVTRGERYPNLAWEEAYHERLGPLSWVPLR